MQSDYDLPVDSPSVVELFRCRLQAWLLEAAHFGSVRCEDITPDRGFNNLEFMPPSKPTDAGAGENSGHNAAAKGMGWQSPSANFHLNVVGPVTEFPVVGCIPLCSWCGIQWYTAPPPKDPCCDTVWNWWPVWAIPITPATAPKVKSKTAKANRDSNEDAIRFLEPTCSNILFRFTFPSYRKCLAITKTDVTKVQLWC